MNGLPGNPSTDTNGYYSGTVNYGWSGTVTPTKTGYSFNPPSKTYSNVTSNQTQDYIGTTQTFTISGYVRTSGGVGISGVVMNGLPGNPSTDTNGYYSGTVNYGWSGTVTPTKAGYGFNPPSKAYSNVTSNQTQDYIGTTQTFTISGYVRTSGGAGISGVVMNGLPGNPSTDTNGYYSGTVNYGWSGTVTPTKAGYSFNPPSKAYSNVTSNQTQDYVGTLQTFTISGYVRTSGGAGISGVVMNGLPGNPSTDTNGYFSGTVNYGWSGTVTPTKAGYSFNPPSKAYSNVTSNQTQDYTGVGISVTSPNGGETWLAGTNQTIRWTSIGDPGAYVKIELFKGSSLNRTISSSASNNGSYSWMVPSDQQIGSDFRIKIISTSNPSTYDYSDNDFTITAWQSESVNWQVYYGSNWNRSGTVTKPGATRIRLHFSAIDLERGYDHLRTDVGNDWSGSYSNVFSNEKSGNSIGLTLTSDFSVNGSFVIDRVEWLGTATGPAARSGDLFGVTPSLPPPPVNVSASDGTYTDKVRVTWEASSGATGYKVFRRTSNNSSGAQQIGASTASQYDDTTAVVGTTYWYWVKAYNGAGESGFSNGDSGVRSANAETISTPSTPSGPPSGSNGTSYSYTTGGSTTSLGHSVQYLLDWGDGTNSGWLPIGTTSASKSWSSAGTYNVKAQARCATDTSVVSSWSQALSVTISVSSPPPPPVNVSVSDGTYADKVRVTWEASSGATGYKVFRNASNNSSGAQQIGTSTASQYDDTTAVVGTTYWYWVKAYNSAGDSEFSNGDNGYVASSSSWQSESVNWPVYYGNNWNKSGTVTKPGASRIRLHFSAISLEVGADHLRTDAGDDWSRDYSNVTSREKAGNSIGLTLTSDYSRTGYFVIDRVEWQGTASGPATKSGTLFQ
jgi:phage gpG-like protein